MKCIKAFSRKDKTMKAIDRLREIEERNKNTKWQDLVKANDQQIEHYEYIQHYTPLAIKDVRKKALDDAEILNYIRVMFKDEPYLYWLIFTDYFKDLLALVNYAYLMGVYDKGRNTLLQHQKDQYKAKIKQWESLCNKLTIEDMDILREVISMNNIERSAEDGKSEEYNAVN